MTGLEAMIESATDKDGYVDMDILIIKYSSPKSNMILNMLTRHIFENKLPVKLRDFNGSRIEEILITQKTSK